MVYSHNKEKTTAEHSIGESEARNKNRIYCMIPFEAQEKTKLIYEINVIALVISGRGGQEVTGEVQEVTSGEQEMFHILIWVWVTWCIHTGKNI